MAHARCSRLQGARLAPKGTEPPTKPRRPKTRHPTGRLPPRSRSTVTRKPRTKPLELARSYFPADMRIPLDDEEAAGQLLYDGIARFQAAGDVYTTPDFDRLVTDKRVRVQVGLSLAGNLIDMDVHSTDVSKEELAALLAAYQKRKRFHRLKDGTLASLADMDLAHLERMARDLGLRPQDLASGSVELPTYAAFFLDREYAEAVRDKSFEDYIDRFENESLYDYAPPSGLAMGLRPYQVDGFRWLKKLASIGFGGILADEMGLGKTLQMIERSCFLCATTARRRAQRSSCAPRRWCTTGWRSSGGSCRRCRSAP